MFGMGVPELILLVFLLVPLFISIWMAKDAYQRTNSIMQALLIGLMGILFPVISWIIYLIVRYYDEKKGRN